MKKLWRRIKCGFGFHTGHEVKVGEYFYIKCIFCNRIFLLSDCVLKTEVK